MPITTKRVLLGVLAVVVALLLAKCVSDRNEAKRQDEAIATAQGFAKVIHETLSDKTSLIVQEADGSLDVTAVNHGTFLNTWQKSTVPYRVVYSVDLSRVSETTTKYDESSKTLFVQIPLVVVSPPNIDETKKVITGRGGLWTSRTAAENLAARSSKLANAGAWTSANKPEKIKAAQEKARVKVGKLLEAPLRATGRRDVNVVVRFPTDGTRDGERWDVSPSIAQILARPGYKQ